MFAAYIHDLSPVIVQFGEGFALRWYGLAYLAGFIVGYYLLKYLSRKGLYPVSENKLADFITWTAIFGVLIGGRLGYLLFYQIPNEGWGPLLDDPLSVFYVWKGGMASHGGIIGVMAFSFYYAWKHRINWVALTDGLAIVAPVGLFFGRMANFINGELYGRIVAPGSSQGMKFPMELLERHHILTPARGGDGLTLQALQAIHDQCPPDVMASLELAGPIPDRLNFDSALWMVERTRDTPAIRDIVGSVLPERYPSQLYEGLAEGLLLFAVLWFVRMRFPKAWTGTFCTLFALLYAAGRIFVENYREPDSPVWLDLTRGQFLSVFVVFIGIGMLIYTLRHRKSVQDDMPA